MTKCFTFTFNPYSLVPLGSTQDEQTLKQLKVTKNAKFMVIGSTINDLLKVATPSPSEFKAPSEDKGAASSKEPLCRQTVSANEIDVLVLTVSVKSWCRHRFGQRRCVTCLSIKCALADISWVWFQFTVPV